MLVVTSAQGDPDAIILASLATGAYTFQVRAVDQLGNQELMPVSWAWSVVFDSSDPTDPSDPSDPSERYQIFLPLVMTAAAQPTLPDLVVEAITTTNGELRLTLANRGQAATSSSFWVGWCLMVR